MGRASLLPLPPCAQDSGCQVRASKYQRAAGRAVTVPSLPLTNIEPRGGSSSSRMLAEKPFRAELQLLGLEQSIGEIVEAIEVQDLYRGVQNRRKEDIKLAAVQPRPDRNMEAA